MAGAAVIDQARHVVLGTAAAPDAMVTPRLSQGNVQGCSLGGAGDPDGGSQVAAWSGSAIMQGPGAGERLGSRSSLAAWTRHPKPKRLSLSWASGALLHPSCASDNGFHPSS